MTQLTKDKMTKYDKNDNNDNYDNNDNDDKMTIMTMFIKRFHIVKNHSKMSQNFAIEFF